ncbi:MAG TPA: phenylalanine 4-monooxygenase [Burkholderiaceae bacterium]|nr:phenylalanine 4-monooxygenase [Burkholderiaceae bacterium]
MDARAEKHGVAASEPSRPDTPDWTIAQRWAEYTAAEHAVWKVLYERQTALLRGRACDEFVAGLQALPIAADRIPEFERLSDVLMPRTGWRIVAVPGLVPDEAFFDHLAHRRFPAGQFIRRADRLDYLEEPDVFHDVFGHAPLLMNPVIADFIQAYGVGGLRAQRLGTLPLLARAYWYTVEFGLVQQAEGLRLYGAGIVSSRAESVFALEDDSPNRIGFELERVMRTRYRIDDFQECYFVLDQLDDLLELAHIDFAPVYERAQQERALEPRELLASDRVVTRGSGRYHSARRAGARHAV